MKVFKPAQYHVQIYDNLDNVWEFSLAFDSLHAAEDYAQEGANKHGAPHRVVDTSES